MSQLLIVLAYYVKLITLFRQCLLQLLHFCFYSRNIHHNNELSTMNLPYSGKFLREKIFAKASKFEFLRKNFCVCNFALNI